ncbi:uncharacterized protein LOC121987121 [Zingiber officinale]|uniref:uncharacterized protein LOC121987121 n=1 Tax=Zingiber officinale TaxID=94328 RepID=UPI001C4BF435|nr:uncharacterized protein LOC121987121 [Zingiber officinale]
MNAPRNNQMIAPKIQKQLVNACAVETTNAILADLGDRWFTLLLDEARGYSVKEQMTVVIRYVNKHGEVIERFMAVVHVATTTAACLKEAIDSLFAKYGLSVARLRGQGYDDASNISGEFNGLKSLIMKENPYALSDERFEVISDLGALAKKMIEIMKNRVFLLVYRMIELALLLPVATAIVERVFSAMNIAKIDL